MKKIFLLFIIITGCVKTPTYQTEPIKSRSATISLTNINVGSAANDGTGQTLRSAWQTQNSNNDAIETFAATVPTTAEVTEEINDSLDQLRADATPVGDIFGDVLYDQTKEYNVLDYGAVGDGTTDDTQSFKDCLEAAGNYGHIRIPGGYFKITSTVNFENNYITVEGGGIGTTRILFAPTVDDDVCFNFEYIDDPTNDRWFQSIKNISFHANETAYTKTALRFVNVRHCKIENVSIHGWGATANDAIGIQTNGREHYSFSNVSVIADRPFVIGPNPDVGSMDVASFHNIYCENITTAADQYAFYFEPSSSVSNASWTGRQSWATKGGGVWMDDINFTAIYFNNARWEQGTSGWMFYLNGYSAAHDIMINNSWSSNAQDGIYLKNVDRVSINNYYITGTADTGLYVHSDVQALSLNNCWATGAFIVKSGFNVTDYITTKKITIGHPGATNTDFAWTSVANSDQQNLPLGAIIPAKARVRAVVIVCTEVCDADDMFMGAGITSGGDEFIAIGTTSIDQVNEVRSITTDGAVEAIPILWATTRSIYISGNPGTSNWNAFTTGEWTVYITYENSYFE